MEPFDELDGCGAHRGTRRVAKCIVGAVLGLPAIYAIIQTDYPVGFGVMAFCYVLIAALRARSLYFGLLFAIGAHCMCAMMGSLVALGAGYLGLGRESVIGILLASQAIAVLIVVLNRTDDGFTSK
jgi:hypothetical protein